MLYHSFAAAGKRNCKRLIGASAAVFLSLLLCSCSALSFSPISQREDPPQGYVVELMPQAGDLSLSAQTQEATVYYRISNEALLAPMLMRFELNIGQTLEEAVIQALIDGPQDSHDMTGVIPNGTQVVSVKEQHGYLEVTLSKEFLDVANDVPSGWEKNPQWAQEVNLRRLLAAYSIINSITDLGLHNAVLILIDVNGDGNGQRVERSSFGLSSSAGEPIEPLCRNTALIQTPESAVSTVIAAINNRQSSTLARFVSFGDQQTTSQLIADTLLTVTFSAGQVSGDTIVRQDGAEAIVTLDCEFSQTGGLTQTIIAAPVRVVREDYIWKVDFDSLCALIDGD